MKNVKNHIDEKLSSIRMDYVLSDAILDKTVYAENNTSRKKGGIAKKAIAAFCCIALLTGATAIAANRLKPKEYIENVEATYSNSIVTVNKSVVKDGIELNVISALSDNDEVTVYFSLKDLTGDRVTEDISFDNWSAIDTLDGGSGVERIGFDEETKTAYFSIRGNSYETLPQEGTLSLSGLYSGIVKNNIFEYGVNLADTLNPTPEYTTLEFDDYDVYHIEPGDLNIPVMNGEGVINNIGIINGDLHIMVEWEESLRRNTVLNLVENPDKLDLTAEDTPEGGYIFTDNSTGKQVDLDVAGEITWYSEAESNGRVCEYVVPAYVSSGAAFDAEKLADYTLMFSDTKVTNFMEKKLSVKYPIVKAEYITIENPEAPQMSIRVSPISVKLVDEPAWLEYEAICDELARQAQAEQGGKGYSYTYTVPSDYNYKVNIEIALTDGEVITLDETDFLNGYSTEDEADHSIKHATNTAGFEKEINLNNVKTVTYNGQVLYSK